MTDATPPTDSSASSNEPIVGIDLGTTNSVVAAVIDGKPTVFPVDNQNWMPSIVGLSPAGTLLTGIVARNQLAAFPDRTVASIKRKMGTVETVSLGDQTFTPPEISAMILRRLRDVASQAMGREVNRAVITVPAYFDEHQRQATRQAGELAGWRVERIINEPTAATLVYHVDKRDRRQIAVYDFGGGTFDVSIVRLEEGVTEVLASQGDTRLGGDDIDHLLLDFVADDFQAKHAVDLRQDLPAKFRLLQACEQAKIRLSEVETLEIVEEFICEKGGQPLHVKVSITRGQLEDMIEPLLARTIDCLGKALRDAKLAIHQIDDLLLVGGSTRIPMVAEKLRQQFKLEPSRGVDPDLAVALGAAVQAAMLRGEKVGPVLVDVSTHTLGIEAVTGMNFTGPELSFVPIIHRGSPLPARYEKAFSKMFEEQERVVIEVFQGEHRDTKKNTRIGNFNVVLAGDDDLHLKIVVRFDLTLDGVLKVTATQPASGRSEELVVDNARSQLNETQRETVQSRLHSMFDQSDQLTDLDEFDEQSQGGWVIDTSVIRSRENRLSGETELEDFDSESSEFESSEFESSEIEPSEFASSKLEEHARASRGQQDREQEGKFLEQDELLPRSEFHADQRLDDSHPGTPQPKTKLLEQARSRFPETVGLLEQADKLESRVKGDDAEDLESLRARIYTALANNDVDLIPSLTAELEDLLFYVQ